MQTQTGYETARACLMTFFDAAFKPAPDKSSILFSRTLMKAGCALEAFTAGRVFRNAGELPLDGKS